MIKSVNLFLSISNLQYAVKGILFFFILACNTSKDDNSNVTFIKGHINNPPSKIICFKSFADTVDLYKGLKSTIDSAVIDEKGNYELMLPISKPYTFNLECGNTVLVSNLFISPGNHLELDFKGKNNKPVLLKSGPEAKYNQFLIQLQDSFYKNEVVKQQYYIVANYLDVDQFKNYTIQRKEQQQKYFNYYFKNDSLNENFRQYVLNTINYGVAVDRLLYLWKKRMRGESTHPDSSYFDFETKGFIQNSNAFACPLYTHFLILYIKDAYERKLERGEFPSVNTDKFNPQVEKYKLAMDLLEPPFRNVVLYDIILGDFNDVTKKETNAIGQNKSLDELIELFKSKHSII